MGSLTELLDDLQHMPEQAVLDLFEMRRQGLTRFNQFLARMRWAINKMEVMN